MHMCVCKKFFLSFNNVYLFSTFYFAFQLQLSIPPLSDLPHHSQPIHHPFPMEKPTNSGLLSCGRTKSLPPASTLTMASHHRKWAQASQFMRHGQILVFLPGAHFKMELDIILVQESVSSISVLNSSYPSFHGPFLFLCYFCLPKVLYSHLNIESHIHKYESICSICLSGSRSHHSVFVPLANISLKIRDFTFPYI